MSAEPLEIKTPLNRDLVSSLRAGQRLLLSGPAYVARDVAHKRMVDAISRGEKLPFNPDGQIIYYAGPTPERPGSPVGSIGPTTSYRMDPFTEEFLQLGLRAMVGKGVRDPNIKVMLEKYGAVYLVATGGAGALLASRITRCEVIAYPDLGPEAVRRIELDHFPVCVAYDTVGGDVYEQGQSRWRRSGGAS